MSHKNINRLQWIISFGILLAAWQAASAINSSEAIPRPYEVFVALAENFDMHFENVSVTATASALGIIIAGFFAACFVTLSLNYKWLRAPTLIGATLLKACPVVVFVPILIRLQGTGIEPKISIAAMISFFPMFIGGLDGISTAPLSAREFSTHYGARARNRFIWIESPYVISGMMTGLKTSAPLAVIGAIVGEYMVGGSRGGLGAFIMSNSASFNPVGVYSGAALSTIIGLSFFAIASMAADIVKRKFNLDR